MKPLIALTLLIVCTGAFATCKTPVVSQVNSDTSLKTYSPLRNMSTGQILLMPPTGGENFTDRKIAKKLCRRGLEVHVLNYPQPSGLTLDLNVHERITRMVLKSVSDFMMQHQKKTVLLGASLGGIYASLIYSLAMDANPDYPSFAPIKGLVTSVAGGPLADILVYSKIEEAIQQRRMRLGSGVYQNRADYREQLDRAILTDPLRLARKSDAVLSYISLNDEKVPTRTQFKLARAHGAKMRFIRVLGHPTSVLYTYFTQGDEIAYFAKKILSRD